MMFIRRNDQRMYRGAGVAALLTLAVLMSGCASNDRYYFTDEAALERQMAVRNIMAQQVMDPSASERNAGQLPGPQDGPKAVNTLQDYRGGSGQGSPSGASGAVGVDLLQGLQDVLR